MNLTQITFPKICAVNLLCWEQCSCQKCHKRGHEKFQGSLSGEEVCGDQVIGVNKGVLSWWCPKNVDSACQNHSHIVNDVLCTACSVIDSYHHSLFAVSVGVTI